MSDGIRTRDNRDHNQVLYLLSYTHHAITANRDRSDSIGRPLVGIPVLAEMSHP